MVFAYISDMLSTFKSDTLLAYSSNTRLAYNSYTLFVYNSDRLSNFNSDTLFAYNSNTLSFFPTISIHCMYSPKQRYAICSKNVDIDCPIFQSIITRSMSRTSGDWASVRRWCWTDSFVRMSPDGQYTCMLWYNSSCMLKGPHHCKQIDMLVKFPILGFGGVGGLGNNCNRHTQCLDWGYAIILKQTRKHMYSRWMTRQGKERAKKHVYSRWMSRHGKEQSIDQGCNLI